MHARSCKAHFQNMLLRIVAEKVTYTSYTFLNLHISVMLNCSCIFYAHLATVDTKRSIKLEHIIPLVL